MDIYINKDGQQSGPFPLDEVNRKLATGEIQSTNLAWYQGAAGWGPVSAIPGVTLPSAAAAIGAGSSVAGGGVVSMSAMSAQFQRSETAALVRNPGGLFSALFDFSFTKFAGVRLIKAIYVIQLIIISLVMLGYFLGGLGVALSIFRYAPLQAILLLLGTFIVIPLLYLVALCFTRILMEALIAFFKLAEDTGTLVQLAQKQAAGSASASVEKA